LNVVISNYQLENMQNSQHLSQNVRIHHLFGFLICPLCTSDQLYEWIQEFGEEASQKASLFCQDRQFVARLVNDTRRYLKLEFLDYIKSLDPKSVIACCHKMVRNSQILKPILKDLHVCISDGFHWDSRKQILEIPVDF
jgi:hypothetical protein